MRAFIAIPLPEIVQDSIGAYVDILRVKMGGMRWVKRGNYHITLKFLGEVSIGSASETGSILSRIAGNLDSFHMELGGVGAFPSIDRPRVVWVGIKKGGGLVGRLQERIDSGMKELGYPPEFKKFHGHVTIGRVKRRRTGEMGGEIMEHPPFFGRIEVRSITLYKSTLTQKGTTYDIIEEAHLGTGEIL